ncbi:MAG TPA: GTPase domain-containing protein [Pseudonocardiaceae bacterium]|nr:GTPase domain-containing protein [Pseudonocardiaceae bacterium]
MSTQQASSNGVVQAMEILDLTIAQAHEAERSDLVERLADARRLLVDAPVTVHVVGGPQQGKSSLMGVLTGSAGAAVPARRRPTDRSDEARIDLPAGQLVMVEAAPMSAGALPPTAGPERIGRAHAVLFVSDASSELTSAEIECLRTMQDLCPTIIFVLTKIDGSLQWRQLLERDKALLNEAGIGVETMAVSATLGTQGQRAGDDELTRMSGVARVLEALDRIAADAEQTSLRAVANHVLFALDQLAEMLQAHRSRLVRPGRSAQARAASRLAEERLDDVRTSSVRWQKLLRDSFANVTSDVDFDLRQRMQAVLAQAEHTIEHSDPAKNWDEFAGWLRRRLTSEAQANNDLAVTSSRNVSLEAAKHVALDEMHIIDPPQATIVTDLPTALTADEALGTSRVGISAVVNIVLRAYMGFVMFYLLTRLIELSLPMILSLVPTLLMGGLAVVEERNRRRDKRREQASTTVRSYITDFSMRVTKESRDLLRQLEQDLRDAYGARSEQMQRSLTDTRNLSQRTLKELEQAPALLRQIDTDVALLGNLRARATAILPTALLAPPRCR